MTARVYVETSVVSYLTSRPSENVVIAAHQQLTRRWWRGRDQYRVVISQAVLDEAAGGDPIERARRLRRLRGLPVLPLTDNATKLAGELLRRGALPRKAMVDALHIAIAATHHVEFLLTWNCKHMANAAMRGTIESICRAADLRPPIICTPEELFPRTFL
jgi:predicted nucleic acid-binding protein